MTISTTPLEAPQFQLVDQAGTVRNLHDYQAQKHVVLVLLRGLW